MSIRESTVVIGSEKALILDALTSNVRLDGRVRDEFRQIRMTLARAECVASAEVQLGRTRVRSTVSGEIVAPFADRPSEGSITFAADISPMAMPSEETGLGFVSGSELTRVLERTIRDSNVLDTESLCIVSGDKVWAIKCDVSVTDYGGSVIDASVLAMMAAMKMFRRSEVQVTSGPRGKPIARVYHSDEKEPIPLALHHIPVCVTLGLFSTAGSKSGAEYAYIVDPSEREEAALDGRISFAINAHREVCAMHKLGGLALAVDDVIRACALCAAKAAQLHEVLNMAVSEAEERAKRERNERLQRFRQGETTGTAVSEVGSTTVTPASQPKQLSLWDRLHNEGALAPAVAERQQRDATMSATNKLTTTSSDRESLKTSQMPAIDEALLDYANLHTAAHVREDDEADLKRQAQAKSRQKALAMPFEESKAATKAATLAKPVAEPSNDLSSAIKKKKKSKK